MDYSYAIERNRTHLLRILAALFALIGLEPGGSVDRLNWTAERIVRRFLLPAETAVRRMIYMAARDIVVKPVKKRNKSAPQSDRTKTAETYKADSSQKKQRKAFFPLFDPRKPIFDEEALIKSVAKDRAKERNRLLPRIFLIEDTPYHRDPIEPQPQNIDIILPTPEELGPGSVAKLCRRLARLHAALNDIPYHALRLARWRALPLEDHIRRPRNVIRRGMPPGLPKKISKHSHHVLQDVQHLLREVQLLTLNMPPRPSRWTDTS